MRSLLRHTAIFTIFAASFCAVEMANAQRVIYVNAGAAGTNDGTSWGNAYADLQGALNDAATNGNCPCDIWVAEGTYKPDRGTGDIGMAFEPADDVSIYGGFGGWESCLDERNPATHPVILSGDLADDDIADPDALVTSDCCSNQDHPGCSDAVCEARVVAVYSQCGSPHLHWSSACPLIAAGECCDLCRPTRCDNSANIMRIPSTSPNVLLDGMIFEGGEDTGRLTDQPNWSGGAAFIEDGSPVFQNCTFRGNAPHAVYALWGTPNLNGCLFTKNGGTYVGSIAADFFHADFAYIDGCTFEENNCVGLWVSDSLTSNSSFVRNQNGGMVSTGRGYVENCLFLDNGGISVCGGGIRAGDYLQVVGCRFFGNRAIGCAGGGIENSGPVVIVDSLFSGNIADDGAAVAGGGLCVEVHIRQQSLCYGWYGPFLRRTRRHSRVDL